MPAVFLLVNFQVRKGYWWKILSEKEISCPQCSDWSNFQIGKGYGRKILGQYFLRKIYRARSFLIGQFFRLEKVFGGKSLGDSCWEKEISCPQFSDWSFFFRLEKVVGGKSIERKRFRASSFLIGQLFRLEKVIGGKSLVDTCCCHPESWASCTVRMTPGRKPLFLWVLNTEDETFLWLGLNHWLVGWSSHDRPRSIASHTVYNPPPGIRSASKGMWSMAKWL